MFERTRTRLVESTEHGFTLIELLVVVIIIGILLAIAVPSYLGFRDRAANNAAKTNLRDALPAADTFHADHGTYSGMDTNALMAIDSRVSPSLRVVATGTSTYCLRDTVSGKTWSVAGPNPSGADFRPNANCS